MNIVYGFECKFSYQKLIEIVFRSLRNDIVALTFRSKQGMYSVWKIMIRRFSRWHVQITRPRRKVETLDMKCVGTIFPIISRTDELFSFEQYSTKDRESENAHRIACESSHLP